MSSHTPRKRVRPYYRADGTYVRGHYRARPGTGTPSSASRTSGSSSTGFGEFIAGFVLLMIALAVLAQIAG
ncbi:hypothetical protein NE857_34120 (plasmid) [Nocardiopsis exhalans]|uniref:Uncharacterized protein n=1 Tax=Nocardiopsis exhalans TaxID=163604 RepID=A0ABY5DIA1_9ACTN|nr:hypothetical protein [Nocardiopsis exhalans]USY23571.1 hypothetical protein NE857_34120 [Nocardiopsis exhalans]